MSVVDALSLMLQFASVVIALLSLVLAMVLAVKRK